LWGFRKIIDTRIIIPDLAYKCVRKKFICTGSTYIDNHFFFGYRSGMYDTAIQLSQSTGTGTAFFRSIWILLPSGYPQCSGSGAFLPPGSGINFFRGLRIQDEFFLFTIKTCSWNHKKPEKKTVFIFHPSSM
jgi:hypothetical protein